MAWSPDGRLIAGREWDGDGGVVIWDAKTGKLLRRIGAKAGVDSFAWSPDGSRMVLGGWRGSWIRDVGSGEAVLTLSTDPLREGSSRFLALAWSPDGERVAAGGEDGLVHIFAAGTGELLRTLDLHDALVRSLAWSPNGRQLVSAGADGVAIVMTP